MSARVILYTTPTCPYCVQAKIFLKQKGVAYRDINVAARPDLRTWLVKVSGQRTVPQIFINGRSVGGFSDISDLDERNALDPLLRAPPPADLPELPT